MEKLDVLYTVGSDFHSLKCQKIGVECDKEVYFNLIEKIDYKNNFSLVEIELKTGRSHQIRVQFSSRGFPLVGDAKYNKKHDGKTNIALFAKKLSFYHPVSNELLTFELDIPDKFQL